MKISLLEAVALLAFIPNVICFYHLFKLSTIRLRPTISLKSLDDGSSPNRIITSSSWTRSSSSSGSSSNPVELDPSEESLRSLQSIQSNPSLFSCSHILQVMQQNAKFGRNIAEIISLKDILQRFQHLEKLPYKQGGEEIGYDGSSFFLHPIPIAQGLYALKHCPPKTPYLSVYLQFFIEKLKMKSNKKGKNRIINHSPKTEIQYLIPLRGQEIANIIYGIQRFAFLTPEGRELVDILYERLQHPKVEISSICLILILTGIRKMNNEEMMEKWMNVLAKKVLGSKESVWEMENLVTIFYLLHPFSSTRSGAILDLTNALTLKLTTSLAMSDPLTLEKCSRILFGLRDFSSQHKEVLSLVDLVQKNLALGEEVEYMKTEKESTVLSMAIHGLKLMHDDSPEVQRLLNYLARRLRKHALSENMVWKHWKGTQICSLLTGLQYKCSQSAEMEMIYEALPRLLPPPNSTRMWLEKHEYDNHHLVAILYEMRNMNYSHPGLQEVRSRITSFLLNTSNAPSQWLSSKEMAMLAYTIQDLADIENCHQDLHSLLLFLERQLANLRGGDVAENPSKTQYDYLSSQGLSMCVKGLHGIFENSPFKSNVYKILSIITEKVSSLDGQAIGNMLYSMRSMSAENVDVRLILSKLSPLIEASMQSESGIMKKQEIANAFFGLQQMSSLHTEVLDIVRLLTLKLKQTRAVRNQPVLNFSAQEIANAISGLQTMSNSDKGSEIVREALGLLAEELEGCLEPMSPREIAYTCFGMKQFIADICLASTKEQYVCDFN